MEIAIALHVAPRVEMQGTHHLLAAVGDVRVTAQPVGIYVIQAVNVIIVEGDVHLEDL